MLNCRGSRCPQRSRPYVGAHRGSTALARRARCARASRPDLTTSKWRVICKSCAQLRLVARKKCGPGGSGFSNLGSRFEQPDQPDIRDDVQSNAPAASRPGPAGAAGCHWQLACQCGSPELQEIAPQTPLTSPDRRSCAFLHPQKNSRPIGYHPPRRRLPC